MRKTPWFIEEIKVLAKTNKKAFLLYKLTSIMKGRQPNIRHRNTKSKNLALKGSILRKNHKIHRMRYGRDTEYDMENA